MTLGERIGDILIKLLLLFLIFITLYPFYYVAVASLSDPSLLVKSRGFLLKPVGFSTGAYRMVFQDAIFRLGFLNTTFYVVVGTSLNLVMTCLGAYALSRPNLYGKTLIMFFIAFTMFFSGGLIPRYLLVRNLGLLNTRWALILPVAINTWNMIIMRTGFESLPESLSEAAKIDGADDLTILTRVYIPLQMPVIAVIILFYAVQHWNSYFDAMIFLRTRDLYPLQLILREILIASSTDTMMAGIVMDREPIGETIKYAAIIVSTIPILLVYPFLQKYFVKGVLIGAIKG
jgi:putative aldouronate transport system permease protein